MTQNLADIARECDIKYFLISFTDLCGVLRAKLVPAHAIAEMQKNGAGFAGFATHLHMTPADADMFAVPDASSLIQLPWKKEIGWLDSDLFMNGKPVAQAPREVLKHITAQAKSAGYVFKTGVECEFFLLDYFQPQESPLQLADIRDTQAKPCYDQHAVMRRYDFIRTLCDYMHELGWNPYQNDHEDGNGQFEMNWEYADCLTTANRHVFFKFMVKSLAEQHGMRASFMPKPLAGITGSGCHMHASLWDTGGKNNLFADAKGELGLSSLAYGFIGGVLGEARALCAVTNPTVNSYKRINAPATASGATWSPGSISYTGNNRTHMIRIPDAGRFELRLPDSAANPYLLPATVLAAGLQGIAAKKDPGKRLDCNMYTHPEPTAQKLPQTLHEALGELERSDVLRAALGEEFINAYLHVKRKEWGAYLGQVSAWEKHYYLDV